VRALVLWLRIMAPLALESPSSLSIGPADFDGSLLGALSDSKMGNQSNTSPPKKKYQRSGAPIPRDEIDPPRQSKREECVTR